MRTKIATVFAMKSYLKRFTTYLLVLLDDRSHCVSNVTTSSCHLSFTNAASLLLILLYFILATTSIAEETAIQRLKTFIKNHNSAQVSFKQEIFRSNAAKPEIASGIFMFSRPNKFRWVYERPYEQLIVSDGIKLWIYDKDLNQVTVKKLSSALGSSPAAILAGKNDIEKNFTLKEVKTDTKESLDYVEAIPKAQDTSFERIRIGFNQEKLTTMQLVDNFGQTTILQFSQFEANPRQSSNLFKFIPPAGADIIGE